MKKVEVPENIRKLVKARIDRAFHLESGRTLGAMAVYDCGELAFREGIAYANEQIANEHPPVPTKRPFLSDEEVSSGSFDFYNTNDPTPTAGQIAAWKIGARWARDKYEAAFVADVPNVEPKWQPVVGQVCAFWDDDPTEDLPVLIFGPFQPKDDNRYYKTRNIPYDHCAALESLDEIGKPPSYFKERGRCTA